MIVRVSKRRPLFGSVKPTASNSENRPFASARPEEQADQRGEQAHHQRLDARRTTGTCHRDAPSVRSVASSRVRCAIVIESELAITNAPTNSAMHAEREQEVPQERDELVRALGVLRRLRVAGTDLGPRREDLLDLRDELLRGDPVLRRDADLVELARPCRTAAARWAGRSPASVAPPIELDRAELDEPGDAQRLDRALRPARRSSSPTSRSFLSAVDMSTTTSSASGQAPSTSVRRVELGLRRVDGEAEVRRAAEDDRLAVLDEAGRSPTRRRRSRPRRRAASRTFASSDSSKGGSVVPEPVLERRTATCRVIVASVPSVDVREDRVERLVDRVGEDERAAHHRDAEHDRDRGERGAELPAQEALEREADHCQWHAHVQACR